MATSAAPQWSKPSQWWPELLTAAVTVLVYARTFSFRFVFDDVALIVQNPTIQSWSQLPNYFTQHFWQNVQMQRSYYRPLVLLWFRINDALFHHNPAGWHVTTVLVHACAAVLVLRLARRLTNNPFISLLAGLIFALHPVHVETAAWISDVVDALLAVFFASAVLCFLRSRAGSKAWLAAALFFYAAAMLTKEPGTTLPAVLFAFALLAERSTEHWSVRMRRALVAVLPFVPLAVVYFLVRHAVLQAFSVHQQPITAASAVLSVPLVLWGYLRLLLVPVGLSPFYDLTLVSVPQWRTFFAPVVALIAFVALLWLFLRREREHRSAVWFALAWVILTLVPALDLPAFPHSEMVHDRYIYLPSIGFCLLLAWMVRTFLQRFPPRTAALALSAICILLALLTYRQEAYWRDDVAMFSRGVEVAPHNDNAEAGLATLVSRAGNYPLAISLYSDILQHTPNHILANTNLGWTYFLTGDYAAAEKYLTQAGALATNKPDAFFDLGMVYLKTGRAELALAAFRHAQSVSAPHPMFHEKMSEVLEAQGDLHGAVAEMDVAVALAPQNAGLTERRNQLQSRIAAR